MYLNSIQRTHCCVSAGTVVTRTRHNVAVYLTCVSYFIFVLSLEFCYSVFLSFFKEVQFNMSSFSCSCLLEHADKKGADACVSHLGSLCFDFYC
jgi:hypothetical protein